MVYRSLYTSAASVSDATRRNLSGAFCPSMNGVPFVLSSTYSASVHRSMSAMVCPEAGLSVTITLQSAGSSSLCMKSLFTIRQMLLIVLFCRRVSSVPLISSRSRHGRKQSIFPLIVLRYYFYSSQMTCKYNIKNELNRNDGHVFILSGRHTAALRVLPCRRNVPQRMSPCRRLRLGTGMSGTMLTLKNILHKYAFCSTAQRIFIHRNPTRASYLLQRVR